MKKLLLITALALTSAFVATPRISAQSANFTFTATSLSVAPGASVTFRINLTFTTGGVIDSVAGLTYFLQQTDNQSNLIFSILNRVTGDGTDPSGPRFQGMTDVSPFHFSQYADSDIRDSGDYLGDGGTGIPTGSNFLDLGRLTKGAPNPNLLPSGTYFIADITLQVAANAAPGTYTISSTTTGGKTSVINNSSGSATFPISPGTLVFTVIPEPSTYALLALGGIGLGVFAYRRRALA